MPANADGDTTPRPLMCSTGADQIIQNVGLFRRIAASALIDRTRTATGARFRFNASDEVEAAVREFVAWENRCCSFLRFALEQAGGEIRLEVDGPEDAWLVLDLLVEHSKPASNDST